MGAEHPIAWCRKIHGGRAWYTGLGHRPELFSDATFLAHLEKGLLYAASSCEEASAFVIPRSTVFFARADEDAAGRLRRGRRGRSRTYAVR